MPLDQGFFFMIILLIGGAVTFGFGFHYLKIKRLIENLTTSKIRSLAMGLVEIYGKVVPMEEELLSSPISKKDCVYYNFKVEEYRKSGKSSRWVTLRSGTESQKFYLKDSTGKVIVDPKQAGIEIKEDFKAQSGIGEDLPDIAKDFLKKCNIGYGSFLGIHNMMRLTEAFIQPEDKLYIIGSAVDNPDPKLNPLKGEDNVIITKGKNDRLFHISDKEETDVRKSFGRKATTAIIIGSVLMAISIIVILIYLNLF